MSSLLAVVALGGNALLRRGEPLEAGSQAAAARAAAASLASAARTQPLVVTHGNGPQVGLLALAAEAYDGVRPYPLDVLGAESEGQIGYVLELALDEALGRDATVTLVTRTVVDATDPAFAEPTKFIGPVYDEEEARRLAQERGWTVKPDGSAWRRVVPSPEPREIVELAAVQALVAAGFLVVCAGGGGVPVVRTPDGMRGVEAVVDKDLASALLAEGLGAAVLVLATDVDAVYDRFGTDAARPIGRATPGELRARTFPAGSMGPKVEAACRFVERTEGRAAIGALADAAALLAGEAGTQVLPA